MSLAPSDRKRWRQQFTIRTLLLVTLVACVFFAGRLSRQDELDKARMEAKSARIAADNARMVAEYSRMEAENVRMEAEKEADEARMDAKNMRDLAIRLTERLNKVINRHAPSVERRDVDPVEAGMKVDELERRKRLINIDVTRRDSSLSPLFYRPANHRSCRYLGFSRQIYG